MSLEKRESCVFYRSWLDSANMLPDDKKQLIIMAILNYAMDDIQPEFKDETLKVFWILTKKQIDVNIKKWKDGGKGAEHGIKGGRPKKEEPVKNPSESPNVNVNVNENVNNNKNVNNEKYDLLLEEFNKITSKRCRVMNDKTKQQIRDRLKEGYTWEDLVLAIKTCYYDKWHTENGHTFLTLEYITKLKNLDKYCGENDLRIIIPD